MSTCVWITSIHSRQSVEKKRTIFIGNQDENGLVFTKSCLKIAGKKTVTFIPDIHYPVGKQLLHNAWGKLRGIGSALGVGLAGENIKLGFNRAFSFTFKDMGGQTCVIYANMHCTSCQFCQPKTKRNVTFQYTTSASP